MEATVVFVGARRAKGSGKLVTPLQGFRTESCSITDHAMNRLVLINPGHLTARRNLDTGWCERKLRNINGGISSKNG